MECKLSSNLFCKMAWFTSQKYIGNITAWKFNVKILWRHVNLASTFSWIYCAISWIYCVIRESGVNLERSSKYRRESGTFVKISAWIWNVRQNPRESGSFARITPSLTCRNNSWAKSLFHNTFISKSTAFFQMNRKRMKFFMNLDSSGFTWIWARESRESHESNFHAVQVFKF